MEIAMAVRRQRLAGDVVTDEEVLSSYPELRGPLSEQLRRIRAIEIARGATTRRDTSPAATARSSPDTPDPVTHPLDAPGDATDELGGNTIRMTVVVDHDNPAGIRATIPCHGVERTVGRWLDRTDESTTTLSYRPTSRPPMASLKIFHDGMQAFTMTHIMADRFTIGRSEGDLLIPHDLQISSRHVEIERQHKDGNYRWFLADLGSRNGTFVQIERAPLRDQDELLIGRNSYRFFQRAQQAGLLRLPLETGDVWKFDDESAWIGRAFDGLTCFPSDPYLDEKHAYFQLTPQGWVVKNTGSLNGVWYRIKKVELNRPCCFQIGEQRFGFSSS